jgi:hypothetical protein
MRKIWPILHLFFWLTCVAPAFAQTMLQPSSQVVIGCAFNTSPPTIATGFFGFAQCDSLGRVLVVQSAGSAGAAGFPTNATPVTGTATGTTGATAASIPAAATKTSYVCGFTITADATALATGTATLSGTISGSMSYIQSVQAVANGASVLNQTFAPCIPGSAVNTAITITSAAAGVGGNTTVNIWGYQI